LNIFVSLAQLLPLVAYPSGFTKTQKGEVTVKKMIVIVVAVSLLASGCTTATQHQQAVNRYDEEQLTVAAVQRNIREGMSGTEVLAALGSPNIISSDKDRNEVWVYDRVGTEYVHSESGAGLISLIGAASSSVLGGAMPTYSKSSGASRRSQRTLTIIVRFDENKLVRDYSYNASRF
jgi:outer membrane protein assembly factor BamE (lipoprotein component of BamABCDE complex)